MDIVVFDDVNMIPIYFGVLLLIDFTGFDIVYSRYTDSYSMQNHCIFH